MLTFELSKQYRGFGISNGLDRGLLIYQNGSLLLDEGMGIGALAVQHQGITYFASILRVNPSTDQIEAILSVDKMLQRKIVGIQSKPLTRLIDKICATMYKEREKNQRFWLKFGGVINSILHITVSFVQVPSKGRFELKYTFANGDIEVELNAKLESRVDRISVMNELSGNLFDRSLNDGIMSSPPSGWQHAKEGTWLYCDSRRLSFTVKEQNRPANLESRLLWGRETDKDHCWSGFIYELRTESKEFQHFKYAVSFRERD